MTRGEAHWQTLPDEVQETLRSYLKDVSALFGANLQAVILFGSAARGDFLPGRSNLNLLLLVEKQDLESLGRYAKGHRRWAREGIVVPLVVTETDLRPWPEIFPLEYLDLRRHHVVLAGRDPFLQTEPDPNRLVSECVQEMRGNLLRLRQRVLEGGASPEVVQLLLPMSVTALLACLRGLAYVKGTRAPRSTEDLLAGLPSVIGIDCEAVTEAWRVKTGVSSPGTFELPRLLERYIATVEQLAERAPNLVAGGS